MPAQRAVASSLLRHVCQRIRHDAAARTTLPLVVAAWRCRSHRHVSPRALQRVHTYAAAVRRAAAPPRTAPYRFRYATALLISHTCEFSMRALACAYRGDGTRARARRRRRRMRAVRGMACA